MDSKKLAIQPTLSLKVPTNDIEVVKKISGEVTVDEIFDMAAFFIKNYMESCIVYNIKKSNTRLNQGRLILSGGAALGRYFKGIPEFITLDYDIKLTYPVKMSAQEQKKRMDPDLDTVVNIFDKEMNDYFSYFQYQLFNEKFPGVTIDNQPNVFQRYSHGILRTYVYTMTYQNYNRVEHVLDVYPVISDMQQVPHYNVFTGRGRHNQILSRNADIRRAEGEKVYYIPTTEIDGIPYASLGYIIWDFDYMINYSIQYGNPKLQRYVNKKNALIDGLNSLAYTASCGAFSGLLSSCGMVTDCQMEGKSTPEIVQKGIEMGLYPNNQEMLDRMVNELGGNFVCDQVKRIQAYPDFTPKLMIEGK